MGGARRTPRVEIEDRFAALSPALRLEVLESLKTIDRIQRHVEAKNAAPAETKPDDKPPLQTQQVNRATE
jgi:hypothetical protein